MTTKELEALIDERTKKQIDEAKQSIKTEMGGVNNITDEKKFDEAVEKAVSKVLADNKKSLDENANLLLNFEKANAENAMKGLKKETSTTVVNEMIGSYLKAMNDKNAMNVKQVTPDEAQQLYTDRDHPGAGRIPGEGYFQLAEGCRICDIPRRAGQEAGGADHRRNYAEQAQPKPGLVGG